MAQRIRAKRPPAGRDSSAAPSRSRTRALHGPTGPGKTLPQEVRAKMERSFGHDFSAVRIHEGPQAPSIGALAYTQGDRIHFAPGKYRPEDSGGQKILAHELAHVVQQRSGLVATPQGKGLPINADPALEAEADRLGERAAAGTSAKVLGEGRSGSSGNEPPSRATPQERVRTGQDRDSPGFRFADIAVSSGATGAGLSGRAVQCFDGEELKEKAKEKFEQFKQHAESEGQKMKEREQRGEHPMEDIGDPFSSGTRPELHAQEQREIEAWKERFRNLTGK